MAFRVFIDPGHGGSDPGAVYSGRQEKDDVLKLALAVGRLLEDQGLDVVYSRTEDFYDSPYEKAMKGNESGADLFLSIHRNAAVLPGSGSGADILVYSDTGFSSDVARHIGAEIADLGFQFNGITERPNLAVLRRTKMPAVLVEAGFIDNENDNRFFDENFDALAQAIAQGILNTLEEEDTPSASARSIESADPGLSSSHADTSSRQRTDFPMDAPMNTVPSSAFAPEDPAYLMEQRSSDALSDTLTTPQERDPDPTASSAIPLRESRTPAEDGTSGAENRIDNSSSGAENRVDNPSPGAENRIGNPSSGAESRIGTPSSGLESRAGNPFPAPEEPLRESRSDLGESAEEGTPGVEESIQRALWEAGQNAQAPGSPSPSIYHDQPGTPQGDRRLYRVQVGAFTNPMFATQLLNQLLLEGFPAFIVFSDGLYRVQVGAFAQLDNAVRMEKRLRRQGYQTFITT